MFIKKDINKYNNDKNYIFCEKINNDGAAA